MVAEKKGSTLEWIWRIAMTAIIPAVIWIAGVVLNIQTSITRLETKMDMYNIDDIKKEVQCNTNKIGVIEQDLKSHKEEDVKQFRRIR